MKYRRHGFEEAKAEALRIAEALVAVDHPEWGGGGWVWECDQPRPDQLAPGFDRRKPVVKWLVWVRPKPPEGQTIDGGEGLVLVDLDAQEARWIDPELWFKYHG